MTRGTAVQDVSLEVRAGEIFGISGLIGAGRTELLRLIYGADTPDTGMIAVGEPPQPVRIQSPVDAVAHGIALITEDRKGEGLLLTQSVASNVSLGQLDRLARGGVVDTARETALAEQQIDALRIRTHGAAQPVGELSGGNQQKVVIGRWLARDWACCCSTSRRAASTSARSSRSTRCWARWRAAARWWSYRATCAS
jgi:ribose transport system ATP-binding protein